MIRPGRWCNTDSGQTERGGPLHRHTQPSVPSIMADTTTQGNPKTLQQLETVIQEGVQTFIEVGLALMEVRDRKLYEEAGYVTFDQYCYGRWGFKRSRGEQLISAAKVAAELAGGDVTNVTPVNEAQARAIAPLAKKDPDTAREVWREVTEEAERTAQPVTAAKVREAVQRHSGPQTPNIGLIIAPDNTAPEPTVEQVQPDYSLLEIPEEEKLVKRLNEFMYLTSRFDPNTVADAVFDLDYAWVALNRSDAFNAWMQTFLNALEMRRRPGVRAVK